MKKKVLLFAAACLGLGMVLAGVGAVLGGRGFALRWGASGFSFKGEQYYTFYDMDVEAFSKITVKVSNCPVTVLPSNDGKYGVDIRLAVGSEEDTPLRIADGELVLENSVKIWVGWNLDFLSFIGEEEHVILYLPEKVYEEFYLSTSNADITVEEVNTGENLLYVHTSNGKITLTGVYAEEVDAKTSNSAIVFEEVCGDKAEAKSSNGRIEFTQVEIREIKADTSNASVRFDGVYGVTAQIESSNGSILLDTVHFDELLEAKTSNSSIEAVLDGGREEYSVDASTSNSEVRIEGEDYGKKYLGGEGEAEVILRSSNGKITVEFQ